MTEARGLDLATAELIELDGWTNDGVAPSQVADYPNPAKERARLALESLRYQSDIQRLGELAVAISSAKSIEDLVGLVEEGLSSSIRASATELGPLVGERLGWSSKELFIDIGQGRLEHYLTDHADGFWVTGVFSGIKTIRTPKGESENTTGIGLRAYVCLVPDGEMRDEWRGKYLPLEGLVGAPAINPSRTQTVV